MSEPARAPQMQSCIFCFERPVQPHWLFRSPISIPVCIACESSISLEAIGHGHVRNYEFLGTAGHSRQDDSGDFFVYREDVSWETGLGIGRLFCVRGEKNSVCVATFDPGDRQGLLAAICCDPANCYSFRVLPRQALPDAPGYGSFMLAEIKERFIAMLRVTDLPKLLTTLKEYDVKCLRASGEFLDLWHLGQLTVGETLENALLAGAPHG